MQSLVNGNPVISVIKHPTKGVDKWQWILVDSWKYNLAWLCSPFNYNSHEECESGFKKFAELNNIKEYSFLKDGNPIQDIRTGSGAMI